MGLISSSYIRSGDILHTERNTVRDLKVVEYDATNTFTDKSVASDIRQNADSVSASDVHNAKNTSSSSSMMHTPGTAAVKPSCGKAQHQPWFFANMTQEHWERLNMMCIEIPSSS